MPRIGGIQREEWTTCARCGFIHPVSMLSSQNGMLLCHDHGCYDNLLVQERAMMIQQVLSDGEELLNVVGEKQAEDTDIPEF
jgi:hypothetical protein